MNGIFDKRVTRLAAVLMAGAVPVAAAQLNIAENPLFISTNTAPNVMLSIDNSGSMDNIVWDTGFDPTITYPNWGLGGPLERKDNSETITFGTWAADSTLTPYSFLHCERPNAGLRPLRIVANTAFDDIYVDLYDFDNGDFFAEFPQFGIYGRKIENGVETEACIRIPRPFPLSTRYLGNYLNYLFETFATPGGNSTQPGLTVPNQVRIQVARNVSSAIVAQNTGLRFGIALFNPPRDSDGDGFVDDSGPGGRIVAECATRDAAGLTALQNTIRGIFSQANTPLSETYYEISRYFRGLPSAYNTTSSGAAVSYNSPQQFRCQKNFVISITDGFPTYDNTFPTTGDTGPNASSLPDFDGLSPDTATTDFPAQFPQDSDGYQPNSRFGAGEAEEGFTLYLDDLAAFGQVIDTKTSGLDDAGGSYENADGETFDPQNLTTYTVGIALDNQMLVDAARNGDGLFFRADNEQQLLDSLNSAIQDILAKTSSAASVATNSTRLSADTLVFQARFSSADWSGDLVARSINPDGTIGGIAWQAAQGIPAPSARNIVTFNRDANAVVDFFFGNLSSAQQAELNKGATGVDDGGGATRVSLLRGETLGAPDARFRQRATRLGDIINSDPAFVGEQDFGFRRLPGSEGASYPAFVRSKASRLNTVFVGANDGMFRGIDATNGRELFAYVPAEVYEDGRLGRIVDADYARNHLFTVDGTTRTVDAFLGGAWKSIVLGSTGAGGNAVFAIDASNPTNLNASSVLWEFSDENNAAMGRSIPVATAARMANGRWAAIISNGYNSAGHKAQLLIIDLETGALIRRIDTGIGSSTNPNGLSSPIPIDIDNDRITDAIYAGDLHGNLWKFDVSGNTPGSWRIAYGTAGTPAPLFDANRPITSRPEVGLNPEGGVVVYFGTGKYFENTDNIVTASEPTHSFYGIFDDGDPVASRNDLLEQTVIGDFDSAEFGATVRITSNNELAPDDEGWFIDLPINGERHVAPPILRPGRIIFTTLIPDPDPCGSGGTSFIMELDALTGSRLADESPFDLNDDTEFDSEDYFEVVIDGETVRVPVSGKESEVGIIKTPGVLQSEDSSFEFKYASGTSGGIEVIRESSGADRGRLSWRQLR